MNIFETTDYKDYLRSRAKEERGRLTAMARAASCQPSYLLRVMTTEAQLTPDQVYRLGRFWNLDEEERDYFHTAVELARAADPGFRAHLRAKLESLLDARTHLKKVVGRQDVSDVQSLLQYHGDWRTALVHFLSACAPFQDARKMMSRARLDEADMKAILDLLTARGLVRAKGRQVQYLKGAAHIPRGSSVLPIFLNNWRQVAVQSSSRNTEGSLHFTNIQTVGVKDKHRLIELARAFVVAAKELCDRSASEDVVVVNLDLFTP